MNMQNRPPDLSVLIERHGHLCPGLAIGYRVARYALKLVDQGPGLTVYSGGKGCPLHAIEMLTGCSGESGTIVAMEGLQGWAFYDGQSGDGFLITLKNNLAGQTDIDKDRYVEILLALTDSELFDTAAFDPPGCGCGCGCRN